MNDFLHVLECDLSRGVSGRVDSLLSQCMYFGLSFSRIGADFRPLIAPVFIRVAVNSYRRALRTTKHRSAPTSLCIGNIIASVTLCIGNMYMFNLWPWLSLIMLNIIHTHTRVSCFSEITNAPWRLLPCVCVCSFVSYCSTCCGTCNVLCMERTIMPFLLPPSVSMSQ